MKLEASSGPSKFNGKVKYSSIQQGAVPWKSGQLVFTKEGNHWTLALYFSSSMGRPCFTINLKQSRVKKMICKGSFVLDYKREMGDLLSIYYKPDNRTVMRNLEAIMNEVRMQKEESSVGSKCEIGAMKTPSKSPLWTAYNNSTEQDVMQETSPAKFTSVKENKRTTQNTVELSDDEEKENLGLPKSSGDKFLERSVEKSRSCLMTKGFYGKSSSTPQPLFNSTPNHGWLNSKRQPGLMPDPTPTKRARLYDSIPYSMKTKPTSQTNIKQQQALQGFSNLGNTCYMNSILQSLFGLDTFSNDLIINRKLLKALPPQSLYYALVKLLYVKRQQTCTDLTRRESLKRVKSAISNSAKRFLGYGQHDAHEFLGQVLDQLKEEVIKVCKSTPSPNRENSEIAQADQDPPEIAANPIIANFEFEVVHSLTCLQCGESVMKAEQFHDISLDLPKRKNQFTPRSLQDALSMFFKNEEIEYACEKCGHTKSFVTHKISRLPRIFILHLKRYLYERTLSRNTKMGQNVAIPQYITLQNHCTEQTQPAYPANLHQPSSSEQKPTVDLDDSKEEAPSRRKLEYKFSKKNLSSSFSKEVEATTDLTIKKEESDDVQPKPLTLEDEEDHEYTRAIEMSLKEHEEKDKMLRDYGDDTEENFERVMELSRLDTDKGHTETEIKDVAQLSEDEQLQLAIQQSLMETHGNTAYDPGEDIGGLGYTQNGDVIKNGHHNYTQNNDVIKNGHHTYTQIDDVTKNGHHTYTQIGDVSKNGKNSLSKSNNTSHSTSVSSYTNSFDTDNNETTSQNTDKTKLKETDLKTGTENISNKQDDPHFCPKTEDDLVCLEEMPEESNTLDSNNVKNEDYDYDPNPSVMAKNAAASWRETLSNLSGCFSSEESEDDSQNGDLNKSRSVPKFHKYQKTYEMYRKQDGSSELESSTRVSAKDSAFETEDKSNNDSRTENESVKVESVRKCQLTNKGSNSDSTVGQKGDNKFEMDFEDDDSWMFSLDDKENTFPNNDKPRLSSPSEFNPDQSGVDEVDGFIEESVDMPDIKNEAGDLPYSYRLVSIVNHMGLSTSTGHYLSDVYDMKKKVWYSYDDSHVSKITQDDVISKRERSGYIFFYMSKDIFDDVTLHNDIVSTERKAVSS